MPHRFVGVVESGASDAARWLRLFNAEYNRKLGMSVFPGSLNLLLPEPFDWSAAFVTTNQIRFGREEYGGERHILLVPCALESLGDVPAHLWRTTTPHVARDAHVLEIISAVHLRSTYGLKDGDRVSIRLDDAVGSD